MFDKCKGCGEIDDLRYGYCFDCATKGEIRAAKMTVRQHIWKAFCLLPGGYLTEVRMHLQWAWERLTQTGDYKHNGYFDREGIKWRRRKIGK